jgi:hypothetical protein
MAGNLKLCLLLSAGRSPANTKIAPAQLEINLITNIRYSTQDNKVQDQTIMAEQAPTAIDTTPISPVRNVPERRNSLEKHLQHRPDQKDLKNRHILLDTTAAPYV